MSIRLPVLLLILSLWAAATVARAAVQPAPASTKATSKSADAQRDILIRLERVPCMGSCPAYSVTILGDRSVTFVANDPKSAPPACCNLVRKNVLTLDDYNKLVKQIEAMKFFKLKPIFGPPPPDVGYETITVINAPVEYNRVLYPGFLCRARDRKPVTKTDTNIPPDSLCKLDSMIDKLTGADKWGEESKIGQTK